MHSLIITAHPRASGFTHRIAESYQKKQISLGHTVELIDLCHPDNAQSYAEFVDESHLIEDESTKRMQEKISKADELVWIFPVWWMDAPAIMKNFWDRNFTSDFAFRYLTGGKVEKLISEKTNKVYATAGGPGAIIGFFMGLIWKMGRFGFLGMKTTTFKVLGNFPKRTEAEKLKFLETL